MNGQMEKYILALIDEFLSHPFPAQEYKSTISPETFVKEFGSIRIDLPKKYEVSKIARTICHRFNCLVVCPNDNEVKQFRSLYMQEYDDDQPPTVIEVYALKNETSLSNPNIDLLLEVKQALDRSNIILCEIFRAFSNNKGIKKLFKDAGFSHRFILI